MSARRQIFISHAMADNDMAVQLAHELRERGLTVWLDRDRLHPGERWSEALREALDAADGFVLLISDDSERSPFARREMSEILKRMWEDQSKVVLPVLIGGAEPPGYLRDQVAVRVEPEPSPKAFRALLSQLTDDEIWGGIHRSEAGQKRLSRRLDDLERAAQEMADETET